MVAAHQAKEASAALEIATVEVSGRLLPVGHPLIRDMTEMRDAVAKCTMDEVRALMKDSSGIRVKMGAYADPAEGGGWLAARRRASQFCILSKRHDDSSLEENLLSVRLHRKGAGVSITIAPGILNPIAKELAERVKGTLAQRIPPEVISGETGGGYFALSEKARRGWAVLGILLVGIPGICGGVKVISRGVEAHNRAVRAQELTKDEALKRKMDSLCFFAERNVQSPEVHQFVKEDKDDCLKLIEKMVVSSRVGERRQGLRFLKVISLLELASGNSFYMSTSTGLLSFESNYNTEAATPFAYMEPKLRALTSDPDEEIRKEAHAALSALHEKLQKEEVQRVSDSLTELRNLRLTLQDIKQGKHFNEEGLQPILEGVDYYHYGALRGLAESKNAKDQREAVALCRLLGEAEATAYPEDLREHTALDGKSVTPDAAYFKTILSGIVRKAASNEVRVEAQKVMSQWAD